MVVLIDSSRILDFSELRVQGIGIPIRKLDIFVSPIDKKSPDAVRTEPIFRDNEGCVFWRLKGFSDKLDVLLQDIGTGDDTIESSESWFELYVEQMTGIDKLINALRGRGNL